MLVSQSGHIGAADETATAADAAKDGRWARRQNCRIAGELSHHTLPEPVTCVVRDTSSSGARLELSGNRGAFSAGAERIPDHVTLLMPMDRMQVECRVTWRKGNMIGVRYLSPARAVPKRPVSRFVPAKPKEKGLLGQFFK